MIWLMACLISAAAFVGELIFYKSIHAKMLRKAKINKGSTKIDEEVEEFSAGSVVDVNGEAVEMVVRPEKYPEEVLTNEMYQEFFSCMRAEIDLLPQQALLPHFLSAEFENGFAIFICNDEESANFLKFAVHKFKKLPKLVAVPKNEHPSLVTFRSFTSDFAFDTESFKQKLPRQNKEMGLETDRWKIFDINGEKLGGFSFMIKMDESSAALIESENGWLSYSFSKIKFIRINASEETKYCDEEQEEEVFNVGASTS